jgi:hypothetical protein
MSAGEVGLLAGRSESAIVGRARLLGLRKREERHDAWTAAELAEVRRCYSTERPGVIAKRLGRSTAAVSWQAQRMGVRSHKALIADATVHDYFSGGIKTPEQAYILGLLAADGNIADDHPRLNFGLQESDAHLVAWMRDRLNPMATLYRVPGTGHTTIQISSRQIVGDLAPFGIVPRKSRTIHWPDDLGPLLRPFLTGHFDGDGWIHIVRSKRPGWGTCSGSRQFLVDMKDYIYDNTGVVLEKIQHRPNTDLYQMATTGCGAFVVNEWLHKDGFGLARKQYPEHVVAPYRHTPEELPPVPPHTVWLRAIETDPRIAVLRADKRRNLAGLARMIGERTDSRSMSTQPTWGAAAAHLGVSVITIGRAYRDLDRLGYLIVPCARPTRGYDAPGLIRKRLHQAAS